MTTDADKLDAPLRNQERRLRRRWPGVSATLCLGRPARPTPGRTVRSSWSSRLIRHAKSGASAWPRYSWHVPADSGQTSRHHALRPSLRPRARSLRNPYDGRLNTRRFNHLNYVNHEAPDRSEMITKASMIAKRNMHPIQMRKMKRLIDHTF